MGQYYKLVNVAAKEFVHPHNVGCGLKAWEIIANTTVASALTGLISVDPGNGPADLGNNSHVGRWAGDTVLFVGDYAEDKDIRGFKPPLSKLYGLCREDAGPPTLEEYEDDYSRVMNYTAAQKKAAAEKEFQAALKRYKNLEPLGFFTGIKPIGMLEQGMSVRIKDGGWATVIATVIHVRALAERHDVGGKAGFELLYKNDRSYLDYMTRRGVTEADWNRPPRDLSWHGIRDSEVDQGQERVLASLDRREFIDPVKFGEVPTTAGIMRGEWGSAAAMCSLLFHTQRRGGGDLPETLPRAGTWLNTRLIASAERRGEYPSTEEIKATFTDISDEAFKIVAAVKAY